MNAVWPYRQLFALTAVLTWVAASSGLWAQEDGRDYSVGRTIPNAELPDHVPAPEGELTLFADFAAPIPGRVPLYLVNRTAKPFQFFSEEGDILIKLERKTDGGHWERAQTHMNSYFCGNSYFSVELGPGQHFAFYGSMPSGGVKAHVRFASYGGIKLVSNEGEGFVWLSDIEDARKDLIGRRVPLEIERQLSSPKEMMRSDKPTPEIQVAALRLLQAEGQNPYYQGAAAEWAEIYETKDSPSDSERQAAKAIREILAEPWPKNRNQDALLARCVEALAHPEKAQGKFGAIENNEVLISRVLGDLARTSTEPQKWKPLAALLSAPDSSPRLAAMIDIAAIPNIADELFPDSFFAERLADSGATSVCAGALSRRGRWEQLANLAWKLSDFEQLVVLRSLAYPPSDDILVSRSKPREPASDSEKQFWKYCLKTQPVGAVDKLCSGRRLEDNSFGPLARQTLREFLEEEVKKGNTARTDFPLKGSGYTIPRAIELLSTWKSSEDIPLFQKLLAYRGYQNVEVSRPPAGRHLLHKYVVRDAAQRALIEQGVSVPADLLLEKEIISGESLPTVTENSR